MYLLKSSERQTVRLHPQKVLLPLQVREEPLKVADLVLREQEGDLRGYVTFFFRSCVGLSLSTYSATI